MLVQLAYRKNYLKLSRIHNLSCLFAMSLAKRCYVNVKEKRLDVRKRLWQI